MESFTLSSDHTDISNAASFRGADPCGLEVQQTLSNCMDTKWHDPYQPSWTSTGPGSSHCSSTTRAPVLLPSSNIFGNSWSSQIPTAAIEFRKSSQFTQLESPSDDSIALKILQTTLNVAYCSLVHDFHEPGAVARQMFRYALLAHNKDELLFNLRWFLGPGYLEIHHLGHASFGDIQGHEGRLNSLPGHTLRPKFDFYVEQIHAHLFLNAFDIEAYFQRKGARFLNAHTVEISSQLGDSPTHISASNLPAQSNGPLILTNENLSTTQPHPTNVKTAQMHI